MDTTQLSLGGGMFLWSFKLAVHATFVALPVYSIFLQKISLYRKSLECRIIRIHLNSIMNSVIPELLIRP